ncbi:LacI family transcriptional regulator [Chloroflexia bacterium SDU3-3]|nr:LacI family transcriptional regulator [Chloroflexia bacterium SDU3-3]
MGIDALSPKMLRALPAMQSLTIEEIATLAQVSRSTVSRVLNNHPNVRAAVRERVMQVIQEHNYAPRAAARSLASNRTHSIGVLVPSMMSEAVFHDPYLSVAMHGMITAASRRGYFVMISMLTVDMQQGFYARVLRGRPFDGLIMIGNQIDEPMLPSLLRDQIPLVLCERHPYLRNLSWVDIQNQECAYIAVRHLLSLGHRRVATITGPLYTASGCDRRDGYKQALLEQAIPIDPDLIVAGDYAQDKAAAAMQLLLALPQPPTAVFAANDMMALGAIRAIRAAGLRVPEDIAIVGFDDISAPVIADIGLTTIRQPVSEVGMAAANLLIDQLESQEISPAYRYLPTELVIRESCGAHLHGAGKEKGVLQGAL